VLLDQQLPRFDFVERHAVKVAAAPATAFAALRRAELLGGPLTRSLLALRALPGAVVGRRHLARRFPGGDGRRPATLDTVASAGFVLLGEEPGREVVLGIIGRFWTLSGGVRPFAAAEFARFDEPGWAKAAWNFRVEPADGGATVSTETRVLCPDPGTRRAFRRYWWIIRPFSGLIRIEMLRAVRREAERGR
jgi:hypothetical protein